MFQYDSLTVSVTEMTWIVTLHRPQALNALNLQMLLELERVFESLAQKNFVECRCVIVTGHGDKAFAAGADLREIQQLSPSQAFERSEKGKKVFSLIQALKVPVIAAVNGFALGGGLELALACDFILASETAQFSLPEGQLGLVPGFGGITRLVDRLGLAKAKAMVFTGARLSAEEAHRLGLVVEVVPLNQLLTLAEAMAKSIAQMAPLALFQAKAIANESAKFEEAFHRESREFSRLFETLDFVEGTTAFFEKRKPQFRGT